MTKHTRRPVRTLCAAALLVAACSQTSSPSAVDMASPMDLTVPPAGDLTVPPPADLSNPAPVLLGSVVPGVARTSGGTDLTISGAGFVDGALALTFGGVAATNVKWVSSNQITAKLPAKAGALGFVDVRLTNGNGVVASGSDLFRYALSQVAFRAGTNAAPGGVGPRGVVLYDFDGDKLVDLASVNGDAGTVTVLKGKGDGTFGAAVSYPVGGAATSYPFSLLMTDVDGDGKVDLVTANQKTNNVSVLFGNGDGSFVAATNVAAACNTAQGVDVGDFNGDGMADLVVSCQTDSNVKVLINQGARKFAATAVAVSGKPYSVLAADVNGDNMPDILSVNSDNGTVSYLQNDTAGGFMAPKNFTVGAVGSAPFLARMVDLDRDGYPELVVATAAADTISILPGTTARSFGAAVTVSVTGRPEFFTVSDVDGDGVLDLAVASLNSGVVSLLTGKGDRSFNAAIPLTAGKSPNGIAVADLDGDGLPELVVTNYGDSTLGVFKNTSQ